MEKIFFSAGCGQKQSTIWVLVIITRGFTGGSVIKNPPANAGDTGSIPGSGRYPGVGNGNPLQYSCWKISWTEEPGRLQSIELQSQDTTWRLNNE